MKESAGKIFSLAGENPPVPGCTTSESLAEGAVTLFSVAAGTNISAEAYASPRLFFVLAGRLRVSVPGTASWQAGPEETLLLPPSCLVGVAAEEDTVYFEIIRKELISMKVDAGKVMKLGELVPYQANKIISRDIIDDAGLKLAVMSFAAGTGLSEHAAPGEALIFALDGEAVIGYEGKEHIIHAGENFKFDKLGRHYVRADKPFKMALLLTLETGEPAAFE